MKDSEKSLNRIPKEQLTAYERWELPLLDARGNEVPREEERDVKPLTAADLEDIRQAAREDGYAEGRDRPLRSGVQESHDRPGRGQAAAQGGRRGPRGLRFRRFRVSGNGLRTANTTCSAYQIAPRGPGKSVSGHETIVFAVPGPLRTPQKSAVMDICMGSIFSRRAIKWWDQSGMQCLQDSPKTATSLVTFGSLIHSKWPHSDLFRALSTPNSHIVTFSEPYPLPTAT